MQSWKPPKLTLSNDHWVRGSRRSAAAMLTAGISNPEKIINNGNISAFSADADVAWTHAILYVVTGNEEYRRKPVEAIKRYGQKDPPGRRQVFSGFAHQTGRPGLLLFARPPKSCATQIRGPRIIAVAGCARRRRRWPGCRSRAMPTPTNKRHVRWPRTRCAGSSVPPSGCRPGVASTAPAGYFTASPTNRASGRGRSVSWWCLISDLMHRATGTDGPARFPDELQTSKPCCPPVAKRVEPGAIRARKKPRSQAGNAVLNERDGTRTRNHRIDSPVL